MNIPYEEILERLVRIENLLLMEKNNQNKEAVSQEANKLLTIDQAAHFLNLSRGSVYQLVHKNRIPFAKRGRLYFSEKELRAWIQSGRRQTVKEIEEDALNALRLK
jgi:excisionase family DNA binding protein